MIVRSPSPFACASRSDSPSSDATEPESISPHGPEGFEVDTDERQVGSGEDARSIRHTPDYKSISTDGLGDVEVDRECQRLGVREDPPSSQPSVDSGCHILYSKDSDTLQPPLDVEFQTVSSEDPPASSSEDPRASASEVPPASSRGDPPESQPSSVPECQIVSTTGSQASADVNRQIVSCVDRRCYLPVVAPASSDPPSRPKKLVTVFSRSDLATLEAECASNSNPSSLHVAQLALRLGQTDARVKAWFEEKRQPVPSATDLPAADATSEPSTEPGAVVAVNEEQTKPQRQREKAVSSEHIVPRERPKRNRPSITYAGAIHPAISSCSNVF